MTPIELLPFVTELLVAISLGLLGAVTRIMIQYKRDGVLPTDGLDLYVESFLGCLAGFLSWLFIEPVGIRAVAIAAITAGYSAPDAIENWLAEKR